MQFILIFVFSSFVTGMWF